MSTGEQHTSQQAAQAPGGVAVHGTVRSRAALGMHLAGASDDEIAGELGFTNAYQARTAWTAAIADTVSDGDVEMVRRKESAALDALQAAVWDEATDPDRDDQKQAIRSVLDIMKARRELLGLNKPTRLEVYSPTLAQIDEQVGKLLHAAGLDADEEADIVLDAIEVRDVG